PRARAITVSQAPMYAGAEVRTDNTIEALEPCRGVPARLARGALMGTRRQLRQDAVNEGRAHRPHRVGQQSVPHVVEHQEVEAVIAASRGQPALQGRQLVGERLADEVRVNGEPIQSVREALAHELAALQRWLTGAGK